YWSRGLLAWIGRAACIAGIIIAASRTGFYLVSLCCLLFAVYKLRTWRFSSRRTAIFINSIALTCCLLLGVGYIFEFSAPAVEVGDPAGGADFPRLGRLLDITERDKAKRGGRGSRAELAQQYFVRAWNGSWYGEGIFTFQGYENPTSHPGAHDI